MEKSIEKLVEVLDAKYYYNEIDPEPMFKFSTEGGRKVLEFCLDTLYNKDLFDAVLDFYKWNYVPEHIDSNEYDLYVTGADEEIYKRDLRKYEQEFERQKQNEQRTINRLKELEVSVEDFTLSISRNEIDVVVDLREDLIRNFSDYIPVNYIQDKENTVLSLNYNTIKEKSGLLTIEQAEENFMKGDLNINEIKDQTGKLLLRLQKRNLYEFKYSVEFPETKFIKLYESIEPAIDKFNEISLQNGLSDKNIRYHEPEYFNEPEHQTFLLNSEAIRVELESEVERYLNTIIPQGEVSGFPKEVLFKMALIQNKQFTYKSYELDHFENNKNGGVNWGDTVQGDVFWKKVIEEENFDLFFQRYPEKKYLNEHLNVKQLQVGKENEIEGYSRYHDEMIESGLSLEDFIDSEFSINQQFKEVREYIYHYLNDSSDLTLKKEISENLISFSEEEQKAFWVFLYETSKETVNKLDWEDTSNLKQVFGLINEKELLIERLTYWYSDPNNIESMWDFNTPNGQRILEFCLERIDDDEYFNAVINYFTIDFPEEPDIRYYDMEQLGEEELFNERMQAFKKELEIQEKNYEVVMGDIKRLGISVNTLDNLQLHGNLQSVINLRNNLQTIFSDLIPQEYRFSISKSIENYIPAGEIEKFPKEIIEKMAEYQKSENNVMDLMVFENNKTAYSESNGFDWEKTEEGTEFWEQIIINENFDMFFEEYPARKYDNEHFNNLGLLR